MRRWVVALIVLLLSCLAVFLNRSDSPRMLADSDTRGLLAGIAKRDAPLSWFASDWPIENHFYRPVSTLTLELNHRVESLNTASGFGLVNAALCIFSICALFWLVRELTDNPLFTALATAFFALWNIDWQGLILISTVLRYSIWLIPLALLLPNRDYRKVLAALLVCAFAITEITGVSTLSGLTLGWIPGRTATTMTLFALCALAAYARYERFAAVRLKPLASTDLPSTKSSKHVQTASRLHFLLPIATCVFLALALGCYEQAVMVPGLLIGVGIWFSLTGRKVRWAWHAAFWAVLGGYAALRMSVLPAGVSQYQNQQFRSGPGVWLEIGNWLLPSYESVRGLVVALSPDVLTELTSNFVMLIWTILSSLAVFVWGVSSNAAAYVAMAKRLPMAVGGWAMSFLAFLPMAWLHRFDHYYYFPMALRSIFVVGLLAIAYQMVVTACSPRSIQAPPRLDPAPGSLPRQ